ncbi:hypothetical protein PVAND_004039 [Polypedilum vanderplanki]|uniref:Ionotropic receptor n=1 Tax=Polypedilum vanderplanki TaxID=319348 RepID=A0A9J6BWE8_POLVA|nr:hypothetical protein PVAND_004039 [Polypedilum vanderplanki]
MIDVIREFYIANDIEFDFNIYGPTTSHINDVINEVTKELSQDNLPISIIHIRNVQKWNHKFNQSASYKKCKFYSKLLFILTVYFLSIKPSENFNINLYKTKSESVSMIDVIREFYIANDIKFDFIIYGPTTSHINDVINEVTKELNGQDNLPISIKHIRNVKKWNHKFNQSAVIFYSSYTFYFNMLRISNNMKTSQLRNITPKKFKFLNYCEGMKNLKTIKIFYNFNKGFLKDIPDMRYFEFILINNSKFVQLYAILLYSENNCGNFALKLLNCFNKESQKWLKKLKNFDHYSSFYGCLLNFLTTHGLIIDKKYQNGMEKNFGKFSKFISRPESEFKGMLPEITEIMEQKLNFSSHYSLYLLNGFYRIKIGTKNFEIKDSIPLFNSPYDLTDESSHFTTPYYSTELNYFVSLNGYYTNYEKMIFPFDSMTWIFLLLIMTSAFLIIFVLHRSSQWIKEKFFGKKISHPAYNALGIFFGISQTQVPQENFSRAILILFIWFCLIFRTCYQSMMFEFITNDMQKPLPESIEDLIEMNYTVVMAASIDYLVTKQLKKRKLKNFIIVHSEEAFFKLYRYALFPDPKLRFAFPGSYPDMKFAFFISESYNKKLHKRFGKSLPKMKNEKLELYASLTLPRNHMMINHMFEILERYITAGIVIHNYESELWFDSILNIEEPIDTRRILALSDLEYGFVLYLIVSLFAILVFIYEINSFKLSKYLRNYFILIPFLRVLKVIIADYHDKW